MLVVILEQMLVNVDWCDCKQVLSTYKHLFNPISRQAFIVRALVLKYTATTDIAGTLQVT